MNYFVSAENLRRYLDETKDDQNYIPLLDFYNNYFCLLASSLATSRERQVIKKYVV